MGSAQCYHFRPGKDGNHALHREAQEHPKKLAISARWRAGDPLQGSNAMALRMVQPAAHFCTPLEGAIRHCQANSAALSPFL